MREASFIFDKGCKGGLRQLSNSMANSETWITAYNVRVGDAGLEAYTPIVQPLQGVPTVVWPYTQLFNTTLGLMVANRTKIYTVDGAYALTEELTVGSKSQRWTLADFGSYMVMANGGTPVIRDYTGSWQVDASVPYTVDAVANYNGQLFAGGFGDAENTVAWSRIGQVDLDTLLSLTIDDKTVSSGTRVMEWDGEIYQVMKLGKAMVVYGSGGVSVMPAVEGPVPTFGYKELNRVGLAGRYCVAGNEDTHLWVDKAGWVWMMKADYKPKMLGYQEFMAPMILSGDVVVSMDVGKDDWYISDGSTTYLCNDKGMTSVYQHPTSVVAFGGGLIGIASEDATHYTLLVTDRFDIGNRGIKTVSVVEADLTTQDVYSAIDYKFDLNTAWATSRYKQFNKQGIVTPIMSGVELRFRFRWTDFEDFSMSYFLVRYKQVDKRSIRGVYVQKAAAQ